MLEAMDDAVGWTLRAVSPGLVCLALGLSLSIWKAIRFRRVSRWGIRLSVLAFSLVNLVPGVLILIATVSGRLLWPAAFAGFVAVALGLGFAVILRQNWAPRATDSN